MSPFIVGMTRVCLAKQAGNQIAFFVAAPQISRVGLWGMSEIEEPCGARLKDVGFQ